MKSLETFEEKLREGFTDKHVYNLNIKELHKNSF